MPWLLDYHETKTTHFKLLLIIATMNPKPNLLATFFIIDLLISFVHVADASFSASSLLLNFRKLARHESLEISSSHGPGLKLTQSFSLSPSPAPSPALAPIGGLNENKCGNRCPDNGYLHACLQISPTDPKEAFLLVKNDGEITMKVNVTVADSKTAFSAIELAKHQAKMINVSAIVGGGLSVVLNAGNGECVIHTGSSVSNDNIVKQSSNLATQGAPIYGVYLIFLTALITGVTWACCKSRKSRLQGNGVPYQELEMGKPDTLVAVADDVETGGWEEDWDDGWDETKAVKSSNSHQLGNISANGLNSRTSDKDRWENNWND